MEWKAQNVVRSSRTIPCWTNFAVAHSRPIRHVAIGVAALAVSPLLWALTGVALVGVIIWETLRLIGEGVEQAARAVARRTA